MRKFETLLLLSPELAADAREALLGVFTGVIEREQGSIVAADHWGMRDLAYPVRKQMRGYYVRLEYLAPAAAVAELERNIRISGPTFCVTISRSAARSSRAASPAPAPNTSACFPPKSSAPGRWPSCSTRPAILPK